MCGGRAGQLGPGSARSPPPQPCPPRPPRSLQPARGLFTSPREHGGGTRAATRTASSRPFRCLLGNVVQPPPLHVGSLGTRAASVRLRMRTPRCPLGDVVPLWLSFSRSRMDRLNLHDFASEEKSWLSFGSAPKDTHFLVGAQGLEHSLWN